MKLKTFAFLLPLTTVGALEINSQLSVDVSLTGVYQYADFSKNATGDTAKGSIATDIGINFHPTKNNELQLTLSFAGGNGLKKTFDRNGFSLMPNADDLEDDLKNINGRNRDYLLEAWYKHTFKGKEWFVAPTVGIIDGTAYIDDNEYANDEVSQFMNDAFVNNPLAEIPSYDLGAVLEAGNDFLTAKGLVINTKNDDGKNYNYYALQVGVSYASINGRVYYYITTKDFKNYKGKKDRIEGVGISTDYTWKEYLGTFVRLGFNTNTDTGDYKSLYSGGVVIFGTLWGRKDDNVGVALAYLDGNKKVSGIKNNQVAEAYYKLQINEHSDLTVDLQYNLQKEKNEELKATVYGIRFNAYF